MNISVAHICAHKQIHIIIPLILHLITLISPEAVESNSYKTAVVSLMVHSNILVNINP